MPAAERTPVLPDLGADARLLAEAAAHAGSVALGFFRKSPTVWTKGDASPVSEADIAADRAIGAMLRAARPGYGWISEESAAAPAAAGEGRSFVVDPIDGTRAFIAGGEDWTISLAVVEDGRPLAAAVFCPVRGEMFLAARGAGAWQGARRLAATAPATLAGGRIAGPANLVEARPMRAAGLERVAKIHSLAYRLTLVAAGRIDAAVASARACHWDLAAADLLVHEAGGRLTDLAGRTVRYDVPDHRHPPLVAAGETLYGPFAALLAAVVADPASSSGGSGR